MKIRVLTEQRADEHRDYMASGSVVDLPDEYALALLARGDAEPVATKAAQRSEKRPAVKKPEAR